MIHQAFVTRLSSSTSQFVPEIESPLPCSSGLVRHIQLFVYFFQKNSILFLAPLTNALIKQKMGLNIPSSKMQGKCKLSNNNINVLSYGTF